MFGQDTGELSIMTTKFVGDDEGNLKELHTVQIERIVDETGRKIYQPIPGTERVFPAQMAMIAIGFDGPEQTLVEQLGLATDRRKTLRHVTANTTPMWIKYLQQVTSWSKLGRMGN